MKSLLYVSLYDPHTPLTGTGTRGFHMVRGLSQRFHLDLVYLAGSGQPPIPEVEASYGGSLPEVRRMHRFDFDRTAYFLFSPHLNRFCRELAARGDYDGVVCDYGTSAAYGLSLQRAFGLPFFYFSHNIEFQGHLKKVRSDPRRLVLAPWMYVVERLGVQRARLVVAITQEDARFYERWADPGKLMVVTQGFDEGTFNPHYAPRDGSERVVLFCGNYGIPFNRDVVRDVVGRIADPVLQRHPRTRFRFVGANPPTDVSHPAVEFTGFAEDYPEQLRRADVVISPMRQGVGCPTKVIEALACGKPTVATPVGARSLGRDWATLHRVSLERFPEVLADVLEEQPPVLDTDFDRLRERYSWRSLVDGLADRLEAELS